MIDTTPSTLLLILYIAAGPASFSITCWHYGVSRMGIAIASIYGNMVPVVVVVIAMIGGRPPRIAHLVGGALIIAGVLIGFGRSASAGKLINYPLNVLYLGTMLVGLERSEEHTSELQSH